MGDMERQRMVYNMDRQRIMDREQQRMDLERERMMSNMDRQRNMDMMTMDEDRMDRYMDQEDNNQMIQTHRMMIKREAESDPAFSYTVMSEHPSETLRLPFYQLPAMARQEYMSPRQQQMTMKQIHPDGAFSYVR